MRKAASPTVPLLDADTAAVPPTLPLPPPAPGTGGGAFGAGRPSTASSSRRRREYGGGSGVGVRRTCTDVVSGCIGAEAVEPRLHVLRTRRRAVQSCMLLAVVLPCAVLLALGWAGWAEYDATCLEPLSDSCGWHCTAAANTSSGKCAWYV